MKFIAGRENSARQPDSDKDDRLLHAQIRCAPHATEASPGSRIQKCARACVHKNESVPVFRLLYPALASAETVRETAKFVQPTSGLSIRRTLSPARSKPAANA